MSKLSLSIGSKVFYNNQEYVVMRAVDFYTLCIAPSDNKNEIINVNIKDLSSKPKKEKVQLDIYSDEEWNDAKKKYDVIKDLVFRKKSRAEVEEEALKHNVTAMDFISLDKNV